MTKRNAASARGAKRADIQSIRDDLDRQWAELQAEGRREMDRLMASPIGVPSAFTEFLDRAGAVTKQQVEVALKLEILDGLPKPGRVAGKALTRASDPQVANDCLTKARGNVKAARRDFVDLVKRGMRKKALENGSADTTALRRWYLATESYGGARRARQK